MPKAAKIMVMTSFFDKYFFARTSISLRFIFITLASLKLLTFVRNVLTTIASKNSDLATPLLCLHLKHLYVRCKLNQLRTF